MVNNTLKKLNEICLTDVTSTIDMLPTNLEIHITDKYVLARVNPLLGREIENLYGLFRDMQRILAYV